MPRHANLHDMGVEAIDEYIAIAALCLKTEKPSRTGVYGFPAALLLFSVVDALSNYLGYGEHSFLALKDMDPRLSPGQVKHLKNWFRNTPAHQAMIAPGTIMSLEDGSPFEFNDNNEPVHIRLVPFHRLVAGFWAKFDKRKIAAKFHLKELPTKPPLLREISGASTAAPLPKILTKLS